MVNVSTRKQRDNKKKKIGRPATGKKTQVMRLRKQTYKKLLKLLKGLQEIAVEDARIANIGVTIKKDLVKPKQITFNSVFDEVFEARRMIEEAPKVFEVEGKLLRGFDLRQAREVAEKFSGNKLKILLEVGEDE